MADSPNYLLYGALAAGAFLLYKNSTSTPTTTAETAWGGGLTPTTPGTTTKPAGSTLISGGAASSAPLVSPLVAGTGTVASTLQSLLNGGGRPGFAVAGEADIVYATAAGRDNANNKGAMLDTQWGDGSRNVRLNLARVIGQQYHLFVEDMQAVLPFRWGQGGFNSWDDMYASIISNPDSLAPVLTAYNQANPGTQIAPRW